MSQMSYIEAIKYQFQSNLSAPPYSVAKNNPANPGELENTVVTKKGKS